MNAGRQLNARERDVLRKSDERPLLFICRDPRCCGVFEKILRGCPLCGRLVEKGERGFRP